MLAAKGVLIDLFGKPEVEQSVLLRNEERRLPREFFALRLRVALGVSGLGGNDSLEPLSDLWIFNSHPREQRQHLAIQFCFGYTHPWMARGGVPATAVVRVVPLPCPAPLDLVLAGDRAAAMGTRDHVTRVRHLMGVVDLLAEQRLDTVPGCTVDQRFLLAEVPLPFERHLADVRPIGEHRVDLLRENRGESSR